MANGDVNTFDLRSPKAPLAEYNVIKNNKKLPVHSLHWFDNRIYAASLSGLFCVDPISQAVAEIATSADSSGIESQLFIVNDINFFSCLLWILFGSLWKFCLYVSTTAVTFALHEYIWYILVLFC